MIADISGFRPVDYYVNQLNMILAYTVNGSKDFRQKVIRSFERDGMKLVGSGTFGVAFEYKDLIMKVNITSIGTCSQDGYYLWAKAILEDQERGIFNPAVPRIDSMAVSGRFYCVLVEKLEEVDYYRTDNPGLVDEHERIVDDYSYSGFLANLRKTDANLADAFMTAGVVLHRIMVENDDADEAGEHDMQSWIGTDRMMARMDCTHYNLMRRGDQLVLSDPIYRNPFSTQLEILAA